MLTWFGKSERPVQTTLAPASFATDGSISGFGFAIAIIMASLFIDLTISGVTQFATDTPRNTSAPFKASAKVPFIMFLFEMFAISSLYLFILTVLPLYIGPFVSQRITSFVPIFIRSFAIAVPAAPAPFITIVISSNFFPISLSAFIRHAVDTTAVPC